MPIVEPVGKFQCFLACRVVESFRVFRIATRGRHSSIAANEAGVVWWKCRDEVRACDEQKEYKTQVMSHDWKFSYCSIAAR